MKSEGDKRDREFRQYLKSKSYTRKGIESRMTAIRLFWKWTDKQDIEAEEVSYNDLLMYMKHKSGKGASQRTIQSYIGVIRHYYRHLLKEKKIISNPAMGIEVKGVKRKVLYNILEPQELQALCHGYKDDTARGTRNKVMLGLLINQGLKAEELARLEVKDINLREGKVEVPGGRKSNSRVMKLEARQVMEIYDYISKAREEIKRMRPKRKYQERQKTNRLIIAEGGIVSNFSNYTTSLMKKVRKINPAVLNARQIRASVITGWLKKYNLRQVQYLAGHRYISSTESYLENELEGLKEEVEKYHPLDYEA
jgi:integrase/recombinase XerD